MNPKIVPNALCYSTFWHKEGVRKLFYCANFREHSNDPVESGRLSNWDGWRTSILDKMQMPSLQMEDTSLKIGQY